MAVVYFTNNASTGAGSLVAAIQSAAAGDVIQPDDTVFERGLVIEIALASTLTIGKTLTFNGGPYRVRLNGGGTTVCANITGGAMVEFVGFDFVSSSGAAVTTTGDVTFDRCRIAGANGDGVAAVGKTVTLKNSVVCGNNGRPISSATAVVDGSTIIGNVEPLNAARLVASNSISPTSPDVAPSQIGFVAAPPDNFGGDSWTANAWQNWDLRLLDDASPTPSPFRDSGDVGLASTYDFQGNFRGRETNGVATCSPGAYETIQADLFCIANKFLPGAPSDFLVGWLDKTSTTVKTIIGWENNLQGATSVQYQLTRANSDEWGEISSSSVVMSQAQYSALQLDATYGFRVRACINDAYTDWATVFFIAGKHVVSTTYPEDVTFSSPYGWAASRFATISGDVAPQRDDVVFVDGDIVFEAATLRLKKLIVGGAATLGFNNPGSTSLTLSADSFDIGVGATTRGVSGTQRLQVTGATIRSRLGDDIYIGNTFFFNAAENLQIAPTSRFSGVVSNVKLYKDGVYSSYNLQITNAATIEGNSTGCNNLYISFQNSTARLTAGGTPSVSANVIRWTTPNDATDDFSALASGSSPIIFAPRRSATVVGNGSRDDFLIDVSNAQPSGTLSLTLTGQTVYGDAPTSSVSSTGNATVDGSKPLTVRGLTFVQGAIVEFANDASVVLTTVSASSATATGLGAFFAPTAAPQGLTLENGAVWGDASAGVTSLDVDPVNATTATFTVVKANAGANIVAQYSDDGGVTWQTVETTADVDEYELTVARGADVTVRVATAAGWLTDTVSTASFLPVWTVATPSESVTGIVNAYEIAPGGSNTGNNSYIFSGWGTL